MMLNKTVDFDDRNSWVDYGMIFKDLTISPPEPNLIYIDIPFRNGVLDETDYYGDITYKSRTLSMSFLVPSDCPDHMALYSRVLNELHGKRKNIRFSADQAYYYSGRLIVGDFSNDGSFWGFQITVTADPYKYRDIVSYYNISREKERIEIFNEGSMKTIPQIATTRQIALSYRGSIYDMSRGEFNNPDIILRPGLNIFTVNRLYDKKSKIRFSFKEGKL